MEASGQYLQEQHLYSKYRLYQVTEKIVASSEESVGNLGRLRVAQAQL